MRNQVINGLSQQAIVEEARAKGAKWVIVWSDHYQGNGKGYYQTVDNFAKSTIFHWQQQPEDRGAIRVLLTDEDVPAMVGCKEDIVVQLNRLRLAYNRVDREVPAMQRIDGRWGKHNPNRIAAEAFNAARANLIRVKRAEIDAAMDTYRQQLGELDLVSSTMIEINI